MRSGERKTFPRKTKCGINLIRTNPKMHYDKYYKMSQGREDYTTLCHNKSLILDINEDVQEIFHNIPSLQPNQILPLHQQHKTRMIVNESITHTIKRYLVPVECIVPRGHEGSEFNLTHVNHVILGGFSLLTPCGSFSIVKLCCIVRAY